MNRPSSSRCSAARRRRRLQRLDLTGAVLSQEPTLSIARPPFVTDTSQVLVGQTFSDPSGEFRIRVVAVGQVEATRIVARSDVGGSRLPGITRGGDYLFLLASQPLGFVDGVVRAVGGLAPQERASLTADTATPFADLTDASGRYLVAARVGVDTHVAARERRPRQRGQRDGGTCRTSTPSPPWT